MAEKQACTEVTTKIKAERKTEQQSKAEIKIKKVVIETDANEEESDTESEYEEVEVVEEVTDDSSAEGEEEEEEEEEVAEEEEEGEDDKDEQEEKSEEKAESSEESDEASAKEEKVVKAGTSQTAETAKLDETTKSEKDAKPETSSETSAEEPKVDADELSKEQEAKEQSKLIILPLLQGLLQKQNSQSNNINTSGNDLESNISKSSEKPNLTQKAVMSSKKVETVGLTVHHVEDSGTESGEDLKFIAAGLRDSLQMHSIQNQSENELINEVTSALNRLESSLREGKDLKLDSKKRNALLSLVARLQTGLISPDKITAATPAPGQTADGDNELSSPEGDNRKYPRGQQRFAKRRNRANRHTVGVSREELADARRYIEEMVMMESISNRTTPDSGNIVSPPEYPVQKQSSCGAVLGNDVQEPSTLFRPNQFVPTHLKEGKTETVEKDKVQLREKKPKPEPSRQTYHFEQSNQSAEASKRPFSQILPAEINNSSQTGNQISSSVEEKNFYNKTHHSAQGPIWQSIFSGMRPSAYQPQEAPAEVGKNSRFINKKMMMKRANTIDIPKPLKYINDMESDSDAEEHGVNSTKSIGLRGTVQVTVKNTPKTVVPPFQPKTENDHKFLAFIQKQNPSGGVVWNNSKNSSGNPVNNWTNKFGNIKNAFEQGQMAISSKPPMPTGTSSSARNFWKKTETVQVKESRVSSSPKYSEKFAKVPPWAENQPAESAKLVVPKPIPVNKFSHAPMSAFKPISPIANEKELAQFQPIKSDMYANPNVNGSYSEPRSMPNQKQSPQMSYQNQVSKPNQSPTLPWAGRPVAEKRLQNIASAKFENRQPQRNNSVRVENAMQQERVNEYNRLEQKRASLPNTNQYDPNQLNAPQMVQDMMHAAIMKEFPPMPYTSTDYSQPATYSTYVPEISVTVSDSLTNPAAEPLILTNNRPFISPYDNTESLATSPNLTQNEVSDSEFDTDSITEYKAETKIMRGPVSQQAVTISNRTMRRGDEGKFGKNSKEAKSLLSIMKNIKPPSSPPITTDGRSYQAPKVESILPVTEEVNRFTQGGTSPPIQHPNTLQGYNPIYQQPTYKPEPKAAKQPLPYQAKPYASANTAPIPAKVPTGPAEYKYRRTSIPDTYQATSQLQTNYIQEPPGFQNNHAYQVPAYNEQNYRPAQKPSTAQQPVSNGYPVQAPKVEIKPSPAGNTTKTKTAQQNFKQSSQQSISRSTQFMTTTSSAPTTPEKRVQPFSIPAKSQSNPSTPKEEPKMVFKKFGPPQPHHYMPNSYQYPLAEQPRKYSEPNVKTIHATVTKKLVQSTSITNKFVAPKIVETPSSPRPLEKNDMPGHVIYNNVNRNAGYDPNTSINASKFPVNPLSRSDSWHQIRQQQQMQQQTSKHVSYQESTPTVGFQLRKVKSGHSLEVPKMFEAGMKKAEIVEKQRTVAAYFSGDKSPLSLSRNSSQTNIAETASMASSGLTVKKTSINRVRTSEKASIGNQNPSSGLSRSQTMPHIASVNLLDESNVEDAFEELLKSS